MIDPIQVLQDHPWIPRSLLLWVLPPHCAPLQIICLVDILMGPEQVIHDHEMDLLPLGQLHVVQPIETQQWCVQIQIVPHMHVVVFQDGEEEFVLQVPDGFDDEAVVAGEVREGEA